MRAVSGCVRFLTTLIEQTPTSEIGCRKNCETESISEPATQPSYVLSSVYSIPFRGAFVQDPRAASFPSNPYG